MRTFTVILPTTDGSPITGLGAALHNALTAQVTLAADASASEAVRRSVPYLRGGRPGYRLTEDYLGNGVWLVNIHHERGAVDYAYVVPS